MNSLKLVYSESIVFKKEESMKLSNELKADLKRLVKKCDDLKTELMILSGLYHGEEIAYHYAVIQWEKESIKHYDYFASKGMTSFSCHTGHDHIESLVIALECRIKEAKEAKNKEV